MSAENILHLLYVRSYRCKFGNEFDQDFNELVYTTSVQQQKAHLIYS